MHAKPYKKKVATIGEISVWVVDGAWVRGSRDNEFTNFGQHGRFAFIPENEFWLDEEHARGERRFFIHHLLVERRLMKRGLSYGDALEAADRAEKAERGKSAMGKISKRKFDAEILEKIHKEKLMFDKKGDITVWLVRGEFVRDKYRMDFTEGGHDFVYDFVPNGEVWIDDDLVPEERNFVLLHELHERSRMQTGWKYDDAHASASRLELSAREGNTNLKKELEEAWNIQRERRMFPIWYIRKTYGFGWTPACMKGWVVTLLLVLGLICGVAYFVATEGDKESVPPAYFAWVIGFAVVMTGFSWLFGEKPRWKWGSRG